MSIPAYIKPGAFVRLRDGSKAEIYSVGNGGRYPVHGRVFDQDGMVVSFAWTDDGAFLRSCPDGLKDIIGPWVAEPDYSKLWPLLPPWIKWLAQSPNRELFGYPIKPTPSPFGWCGVSSFSYIWIPHDYRPELVGDWKDSLQERPTP